MILTNNSKVATAFFAVVLAFSYGFGSFEAYEKTSATTFCCSQNFKECVTWRGTTQNACESCDQEVFWIEIPTNNCKPRYDACLGYLLYPILFDLHLCLYQAKFPHQYHLYRMVLYLDYLMVTECHNQFLWIHLHYPRLHSPLLASHCLQSDSMDRSNCK